jgi:hypothetical protein
VRGAVVNGGDQLNQFKNEADAAARKTVKDFTSCPSPAAQTLYDDLEAKRDRASSTQNEAAKADRDALAARDDCKAKTHLDDQCNTSYNGLSFRITAETARATVASLNASLQALKSLKCVSGCDKSARLLYPAFQTQPPSKAGNTALVSSKLTGIAPVGLNLPTSINYCAAWDPGSLKGNFDSGNGQLTASVTATLPHCTQTGTLACCSEFDLAALLPRLKKLALVPPDLTASDLNLSIPNKSLTAITGVQTATCSQTLKICKRSSATVSVNLGTNPFSTTPSGCQEWADVGCATPPLGLQATTSAVSVPDLTHAKLSWKGSKLKGGSIEVDLSKPDFQGLCKRGCDTQISTPNPHIGTKSIDLGWACLAPRFTGVVGRP